MWTEEFLKKNVYRTMELKGEGVMDGESGENEAGDRADYDHEEVMNQEEREMRTWLTMSQKLARCIIEESDL